MKLKKYSTIEVITVPLSIILIIGTGLAVFFMEKKGGEIADYANLAAIVALTTYVFLKSYSTSEDITHLKERINIVEPFVQTNTQDLNKIKDWVHLIEPTILSHSYSQKISNEEEFNTMLVDIANNNKNILKEMIKGRFVFSSDVFTDYWIPLLGNSNVKEYHSTAIIEKANYFEENQLKKMILNNIHLSQSKPIKLLWFVHDDIISNSNYKKKIKEHKEKIMSGGKKGNVIVRVASMDSLTESHKKDFGIACDLAYAILNQDPEDRKEKFILDYNKLNLEKYKKLFKSQDESITVHGEITL
jgi:hypothetical protein